MYEVKIKKGGAGAVEDDMDKSRMLAQAFEREPSTWKSLLWFALCLLLLFCAKIVPSLVP
jgi:hypothetical protein